MTTHRNSTALIPLLFEREGHDELRYVPTCHDCGKPVLDITKANVAVVGWPKWRSQHIGKHNGATVSRLAGTARVFHWECERKRHESNYSWAYAGLTFRDRDDAAQQLLNPTFRSITKRRKPQ